MNPLPRVSFYPLKQSEPGAELLLACRLAEKAVRAGRRVYLLSASSEQLDRLDDLLWQFRPESFLPHERAGTSASQKPGTVPLVLGTEFVRPDTADVLINLSPLASEFHLEFKDIREIVAADAENREAGRQRYRFYQAKGCTVETVAL